MVPPTGIEPVSSASYHFGFRRLIKRSWSGLCLCHGLRGACRQEPSSLYTFPLARAWLGVATGRSPEGSPTLTPFSRRFRIRLPSERRHSFYPLNYGEKGRCYQRRRRPDAASAASPIVVADLSSQPRPGCSGPGHCVTWRWRTKRSAMCSTNLLSPEVFLSQAPGGQRPGSRCHLGTKPMAAFGPNPARILYRVTL